jgi:hypothetical protein
MLAMLPANRQPCSQLITQGGSKSRVGISVSADRQTKSQSRLPKRKCGQGQERDGTICVVVSYAVCEEASEVNGFPSSLM